MRKINIEILSPAWAELDEIAEYHKIFSSLERLEQYPLSCPYIPDEELRLQEYRVLICGKYVCIYRLISDTIYVYHIVHGSREYSKLFSSQESAPIFHPADR